MASESKENIYSRVLRSKRRQLMEETPEPTDIIEDSRLSPFFTTYETKELTSLPSQVDRVEKFLKFLEWKGPLVYETFLTVLEDMRPSLARKLYEEGHQVEQKLNDRTNSNEELLHQRAVQVDSRGDIVEEADIMGLNYCSGPSFHISRISYSGRELLSQHLNTPSHNFQSFCTAMNIDQELVQKSRRSGNPIAWLLQELSSDPSATMEQLSLALERIGKSDLYESLLKLLDV